MIDPSDPVQVERAVAAYLAADPALRGCRIADAPTAIGRGFDSFIYGFSLEGDTLPPAWRHPLVLRLQRAAGDLHDAKVQREAAVQRFVIDQGYPALDPLAVECSGGVVGLPFTIMRRVSGGAMLERITGRPWEARALLRRMASLHARLHRLSIDGAPLPSERSYVESQLDEALGHMTPDTTPAVRSALEWVQGHVADVLPEHPVLIHNDFHPLNVLIDRDRDVVIDWTLAAIGDRHADVARTVSLFWFASIAATSTFERVLLKAARGRLRAWYFDRYEHEYPVDGLRLAVWEALAIFGAMEGLARGPAPGEARTEREQALPPKLFDELNTQFWRKAHAAERALNR